MKNSYHVGSVVDLMGEKCVIVHAYENDEYDIESLELTDQDGDPCFYGRVKGETLNMV
jgi:hypothetical protein